MSQILANRPAPTPSQLALMEMERQHEAAINALHQATLFGFRTTWHSDTPTATLLADMGPNAVVNFRKHALAVQILLLSGVEMDPADYTPPADRPYTEHDDGTITLDNP